MRDPWKVINYWDNGEDCMDYGKEGERQQVTIGYMNGVDCTGNMGMPSSRPEEEYWLLAGFVGWLTMLAVAGYVCLNCVTTYIPSYSNVVGAYVRCIEYPVNVVSIDKPSFSEWANNIWLTSVEEQ